MLRFPVPVEFLTAIAIVDGGSSSSSAMPWNQKEGYDLKKRRAFYTRNIRLRYLKYVRTGLKSQRIGRINSI